MTLAKKASKELSFLDLELPVIVPTVSDVIYGDGLSLYITYIDGSILIVDGDDILNPRTYKDIEDFEENYGIYDGWKYDEDIGRIIKDNEPDVEKVLVSIM